MHKISDLPVFKKARGPAPAGNPAGFTIPPLAESCRVDADGNARAFFRPGYPVSPST